MYADFIKPDVITFAVAEAAEIAKIAACKIFVVLYCHIAVVCVVNIFFINGAQSKQKRLDTFTAKTNAKPVAAAPRFDNHVAAACARVAHNAGITVRKINIIINQRMLLCPLLLYAEINYCAGTAVRQLCGDSVGNRCVGVIFVILFHAYFFLFLHFCRSLLNHYTSQIIKKYVSFCRTNFTLYILYTYARILSSVDCHFDNYKYDILTYNNVRGDGMMLKIADRIKTARENLSLTQTNLSKKMSVSRSSVNAWEMGISIPSSEKIAELACVLGVSTDYLFGKDDTDSVSLDGLSEEEKIAVINLIRIMKEKK